MVKSRLLMESIQRVARQVLGEDMTTMGMIGDMMNGKDGSVSDLGPSPQVAMGGMGAKAPAGGYQSLAKVVGYTDDMGKSLFGIGQEIEFDPTTGETNMMAPSGAMMTIGDIQQWVDLDVVDSSSKNDSSEDPSTPTVMQET